MRQIFILSPAKTSGQRAQLIYNPAARFSLASRLHRGHGVPLAEVFSFLSGLYFRGKITYARTFAHPPAGMPGIMVVTSNRGLLPVDLPLTLEEVRAFSAAPIDLRNRRYLKPLQRDAAMLAQVSGAQCRVVFLGSISTSRYADPLLAAFGERLHFPSDFIGRGDMSRGGLLLRAAAEKKELAYVPLAGAVRRGKRPQKLAPRTWGYRILEGKTYLPNEAAIKAATKALVKPTGARPRRSARR
jgi:hypothetical protein